MADAAYTLLPTRGLIAIDGDDCDTFLQGLISCDVAKVTDTQAGYGAFLTPQGKFLHDFFLVRLGTAVLLDCEAERLADLKRRLSMYKLRAKVTVNDVSDDFVVAAGFGSDVASVIGVGAETGAAAPFGGGIAYTDPRLGLLGARFVIAKGAEGALSEAGLVVGDIQAYDTLRLQAGVADGSRDMVVDKAVLLENGFDELNGVDWQKGCYMGQELTARTKYRGLVKKRLMPVTIDGPLPEPGTPVMLDGKEAGEMRSGQAALGLALMRLDALEKASAFACGDATLTPNKPEWAVFGSDDEAPQS